jgi:hypothetical protein
MLEIQRESHALIKTFTSLSKWATRFSSLMVESHQSSRENKMESLSSIFWTKESLAKRKTCVSLVSQSVFPPSTSMTNTISSNLASSTKLTTSQSPSPDTSMILNHWESFSLKRTPNTALMSISLARSKTTKPSTIWIKLSQVLMVSWLPEEILVCKYLSRKSSCFKNISWTRLSAKENTAFVQLKCSNRWKLSQDQPEPKSQISPMQSWTLRIQQWLQVKQQTANFQLKLPELWEKSPKRHKFQLLTKEFSNTRKSTFQTRMLWVRLLCHLS